MLLCCSILLILFLNTDHVYAVGTRKLRLYTNYVYDKSSAFDRRHLESGSSSLGDNKEHLTDDYYDENQRVGQQDFEGLFEEKGAFEDQNDLSFKYKSITLDYDEEGMQKNNDIGAEHEIKYYGEFREELAANMIQDISIVYDNNSRGDDWAPEISGGAKDSPTKQRLKHGNAGQALEKNTLPSFEATPMPNQLTLSQWRSLNKKLEKELQTEELTSSLYLVSQAKPRKDEKSYVASCLVVRDEHDTIIEWINHHLALGIRKTYIYDHLSFPPLDGLLESFMADGRVIYERLTIQSHTDEISPQLSAYNKCLREHGHKHTWLAFLDVDEFIMFRNGHPIQSLPAFLTPYESYSALAIHWILFGSSGHDTKPTRSVLRSYTKCMPLKHAQHLFVKSIVNTRCTIGTTDSPHSFKHNCSAPAIRTDMSPINGATTSELPLHDVLAIHHYATKSLEDFELKVLKGSGMRRQRGWEYFFFVDGWSTEFNFDGLKVWNSDVITKSRVLDPETLNMQIEGYSKEVLEDFWGNMQPIKEDTLDYTDQDDEYRSFQKQQKGEPLDDDAEEGEW